MIAIRATITLAPSFPRSAWERTARRSASRQRGARAHVFEAIADRDALIGRELRSVAEKLCGGSVTPLLTHLVRTQRLSARDRAELRALIDALEDKGGKRGAR